MSDTETVENYEKLKENKGEVVESIAEETGMTSQNDKEIIGETIEEMYIDEAFSDMRFEETEKLSPSLWESIISKTSPSHGVAEVSNVRSDDGYLQIRFKVRGTERFFTRTYDVGEDLEKDGLEGSFGGRRTSSRSREEFEKLVRLTESEINKPTTMIGSTIPIKPESKGDDYSIHYPPKSTSIPTQFLYRIIRLFYNHDLVSYNPDKDRYDFSYTPNKKTWLLALAPFVLSAFTPPAVSMTAVMIGTLMICLVISVHVAYLSD